MTVDEYIAARKGNIKDLTLKDQEYVLNRMFDEMGVSDGEEPTPSDFRQWLIKAKQDGDRKHTTIADYCSIFRKYCETLGLSGLDEVRRIVENMKPSVSSTDYTHGYLSKEQLKRVFDMALPVYNLSFAVAYSFARRRGEVERLKAKDVGEDSISFPILKKKGLRYVEF